MKIFEILNEVRNTAGSKAKKDILNFQMNEVLEQIFADTYDKSRNYYVKKYNREYETMFSQGLTIDGNYDVFHNMLDKLNNREVTGDAAVALVEDTIAQYVHNEREILHLIMDRNLKIGVGMDSFNKVGGANIDKFEVALAYNLDKVKNVNPIDGTYYASRKLDGCVDYYSVIDTDRGPLTIGEIVENNIKCKVKSWDGQHIVYRPIISTFCGDTSKQWYKITLKNGSVIKITENDRLMTSNGWKYVKDLTKDDKIMCDY